jgi:hypothetical protein
MSRREASRLRNVRFEILQMHDEEAQAITTWRYEPPYSFYDADADAGDLALLLWEECRAGFLRLRTFDHSTNGGVFPFLEMTRSS